MEIIPDLSFCVTADRGPELLRLVLQSIYDTADHVSFEIFVVGRGAEADLAAMLVRLFPDVHLFESDGNEGLPDRQNDILRLTRGRYVVLWAGDLLCRPGCLSRLLGLLDDNPEVGLAAPAIVASDNVREAWPLSFPGPGRALLRVLGLRDSLFDRCPMVVAEAAAATMRAVDWLPADCLVLRREALEEAGYLDEGYAAMAAVAMDYCRRLKEAGWHVHFLAVAGVERVARLDWLPGPNDEGGDKVGRERPAEISPGDLARFFWKKWFRPRSVY